MVNKKILFVAILIWCISLCTGQETGCGIIHADINSFSIGMDVGTMELPRNIEEFSSLRIINSTFAFPYFEVLSDGVLYIICYDWNMKVRYIGVEDGDFKTPEGVYLGMSYKDFRRTVGPKKMRKERFVGYYVKLPSGWSVSFYAGTTGIEHPPEKDDVISLIYKMKR